MVFDYLEKIKMAQSLTLRVLDNAFALYRLPADTAIPSALLAQPFYSITRTADELSIMAAAQVIIPTVDAKVEAGWRAIMVQGPLDFALVGVLARLTAVFAAVEISVFAISTFDTDYIFVKDQTLADACLALKKADYQFVE